MGAGWPRPQGVHLRRQGQFQPLGHVILDQEARLADRGALGIGIGGDAPGAAQRARQDRDRQRPAAEALVLAPERDGIRRRPDAAPRGSSGTSRHRGALAVAQQRRQRHRLAGAIDAALGIEIGVDGARRRRVPSRRDRSDRRPRCRDRENRNRRPPSPPRVPARARPRRARGRDRRRRRPTASVFLVASTSLLRATSRTSTSARGSALASERTKTCTPPLPVKAVRPRSDTTNHCVAMLFVVVGAFVVDGRAVMRLCGHDVDAGLELARPPP